MKRSLFLISLVLLTVLFSCQNRVKKEDNINNAYQDSLNEAPIVEKADSTAASSIGENVAENKAVHNSISLPEQTSTTVKEAPVHQSPEQKRIDSIKNAKSKIKN